MIHTKMPPKLLGCKCAHEFQDQKYGDHRRVHNPCKHANDVGYRCTVCDNKVLP